MSNDSPEPSLRQADVAERATLGTMAFFGSGGVAVGVKNVLFGSWVLLYYNQVLELSPWLASLALGLALIFDAISDPLVGAWSDRVHSRFGRRHPFMYASIIPFTAAIYFILQPPQGLSETELFLYLLVLAVAVRVSMTFYEVPRQALGPELTKDYEQRTQLVGIATAFGFIGGTGMSFYIMTYLFPETAEYSGSEALLNPAGYAILARTAAVVVFVSCVVSTLGLQNRINRLYVPPITTRPTLRELLREAEETLSNRSWLVLFFAGMVFALFVGLQSGIEQYYNVYFWEWVPYQIRLFPLAQLFVALTCALLAGAFAKGRDKKRVAVVLFSACVVLGPLPVGLRLLTEATGIPLFPANGTDFLWWALLIHSGLMTGAGVVGFILIGSMTADIVEESQEATGRRSEGLISAGPALAQKTMSAGGVLILGGLLEIFGFNQPDPTVESMREPMQQLAKFQLALVIVFPAISTWLISKYSITREGHEKRIEELGYTRIESTE